MEISYTDLSGKEILISQIPHGETYVKVFKEKGLLKKRSITMTIN